MKIGQISPNSFEISREISRLSSLSDVKTIVEVGTWNGMGSTKCVLDGLRGKDDYLFISYECWEEMYKEAILNNSNLLNDNFKIILGKLVDEDKITDWFDMDSISEPQISWLNQDISRMSAVKNVFCTVPEKIDLLILDGGEFSTYKEWLLLKDRTKFVVLDDTSCLKTKKIRKEIIDSGYEILADFPNERNGFLSARLI